MSRKAMQWPWLTNAFTGLTVLTGIGAGAYLTGRYNAQRTWTAHQQPQALSSPSHNPTQPNRSTSTKQTDTTGKERTSTWSPTGDTIFAFGNSDRYFFAYRNDPHGTNWQLNSRGLTYGILSTGLRERMVRPYFYAWTSTDDELIGYMNGITETPTWQFRMDPHRPVTAPTYSSLLHWLNDNVKTREEIQATKVVFGEKSSYFAQNGKKCIYHDFPPTLHNHILERKHALSDPAATPTLWIPRIIALGRDNTYIALWHNGDKLVSLSPTSALTAELTNKDNTGIPSNNYENIVLSPFNASNFFRVTKTGHIKWSMACSDDVYLDLTTQVGIYSQVRAKEDGTTFSLSNTVGGVTREIDISPDTDHGEISIRAALEVSGTETNAVSGLLDRVKALIW